MFAKQKYFDSDDIKFSYALQALEGELLSIKKTLVLFCKSSFVVSPHDLPLDGCKSINDLAARNNMIQEKIAFMRTNPDWRKFVIQHTFQAAIAPTRY